MQLPIHLHIDPCVYGMTFVCIDVSRRGVVALLEVDRDPNAAWWDLRFYFIFVQNLTSSVCLFEMVSHGINSFFKTVLNRRTTLRPSRVSKAALPQTELFRYIPSLDSDFVENSSTILKRKLAKLLNLLRKTRF